jgi:enoyl-CoA hydratase
MFAQVAAAGQDAEPARRAESLRRQILALQDNLTCIERCRKPVLAAIHGYCLGAGLDMISCCDMRYCSTDARFSIKEIELGMTADVGSLQRLPHLIPQGILRELAYSGRLIEAEEARSIGLVNRVFADAESLEQGVLEVARQIAERSPLAIRGTKEMLLYARDHGVAEGLNYVATWNAGMLSESDVLRSVEAGMQGQPPDYDD